MCKIKSIEYKFQFSKCLGRLSLSLKKFFVGTSLVFGITVMAAGQQGAGRLPQAPSASSDRGQSPVEPTPSGPKSGGGGQPAPRPQSAGAPVDSGSYKVGPSDILFISIWKEGEFSGPVSVHEDGKITLPLVGDLQAGGKTPKEIEKIVADALSKYVVNPLVTVTVQQVLSKKYYLDGEVAKPGEYSLVAPTTVLEAISKAGGLALFANAKKIYILRNSKQISFNYKDVIRGKHMEQNILLKPDDHVFVP